MHIVNSRQCCGVVVLVAEILAQTVGGAIVTRTLASKGVQPPLCTLMCVPAQQHAAPQAFRHFTGHMSQPSHRSHCSCVVLLLELSG